MIFQGNVQRSTRLSALNVNFFDIWMTNAARRAAIFNTPLRAHKAHKSMKRRSAVIYAAKFQNGIFGMPFMPLMRFIIFIMPPPFIFFIMSCICSNSLSMRFTSCT